MLSLAKEGIWNYFDAQKRISLSFPAVTKASEQKTKGLIRGFLIISSLKTPLLANPFLWL